MLDCNIFAPYRLWTGVAFVLVAAEALPSQWGQALPPQPPIADLGSCRSEHPQGHGFGSASPFRSLILNDHAPVLLHLFQGIDHFGQQLLGLFRNRIATARAHIFHEFALTADLLFSFGDVSIYCAEIAL
jgi:hypothetical protein